MVAVAQLVESRIVIPVVVGSSPISHPTKYKHLGSLYLGAFSLWHTHGTFTTNSKNLYKNLKSRLKKLRELGAVTIEKFNNCFSNEWAQVIEDCSNQDKNV